ncbi:MAG: ATP-dependent DNA ligase [Candidatus Binatus sp.]|uniref:ATP-dependent DNA ligase n=1 Tax=Candidatus Binatus sp. TaxID=2811406 RepID=UPI00271D0763|nr:ATP-dependent DNA ligase [Candidatus Binatus sp.]MDO8431351.1 ATP-dependent DNA ligase [Candidatus Binatus sp.]
MPSLYDFALVCQSLSQTQSRLQMAETVGTFLAALDIDEAEIAARFLVGKAIEQGEEKRLQVSGRAIWKIVAEITGTEDQGEDIFTAAEDFGEAVEMMLKHRSSDPEPTLTIRDLDAKFAEIAAIEGRHARNRKLAALKDLFERSSALEGKYIAKILIREMRHGMSEGLMLEAIAKMASKAVADVRRINMLEGDVGRVVRILRSPPSDDPGAESQSTISTAQGARVVVKPLKPMLAHPAPSVADAFASIGPELALEHKVDGARVQIHQLGASGGVRIFSRRLNEITESLPEVVEMMDRLGERRAIFDGEVIAVDAEGRPVAFQELMRRFGRTRKIERARFEQPIRLFLFDLLSIDGELCIDRPYAERIDALSDLASAAGLELIGRVVRPQLPEAEKFYDDACATGFEGVMAKALASAYTPGVRGRGWLKIKHTRTLDLAIIGAEWGYGRRHGWLSNYHLAARDEQNGGFVMIGKTFKGLTDDQFREMTEKLLALKIDESRGTVFVKPSIVVEVAYNDIQRSPQYAGGMALRFARIVRTRPDKSVEEADSIATVRADFERQLVKPVG